MLLGRARYFLIWPFMLFAGGRVLFQFQVNYLDPIFWGYILLALLCFLQRLEVERTLTDAQRDEFEDMLRALTLERSQIKEAMGFSLDNADAAGEVSLH